MQATTCTCTALVADLTEGVSARTGKAYRYHNITVLQKSRNAEEVYFLKDGETALQPGGYEFEVSFSRGKDGKSAHYFNSPRAVD